jgi:hypothetical protein
MESPTLEIIEQKTTKTPQKILNAVNAYQQANKEAVNLKMKRYYARLKEDPVRLAHMKERQKKSYENRKALKIASVLSV